jgi:DNA-binding CsgD family transcriptional regulator
MSEAVRRWCRDHAGDERELRVALVEALRAQVPFSFHVWLLVDPETEVGTAPLATLPEALAAELPTVIRTRYATALNRWDMMATSVVSLDRATDGRREKSRLHRELLGPHGVGDVASIAFRDPHGCWGFLDLWRMADDPCFSDRELGALADDADSITLALRRCQARSFDTPLLPAVPPGPAVMFLAPDLRVIGQTPDTDEYLRALLPTEADRRPIPAGAYNVSAALVAAEAGHFEHAPVARVRPAQATWLTFAASRVETDRHRDEQDIAVTMTVSSPGERLRLYVRAHGLSPREIDVLERLAGGADTRAIAEDLFVSEHTVQDHLKSVFDKTGARNRRTLLARINGR